MSQASGSDAGEAPESSEDASWTPPAWVWLLPVLLGGLVAAATVPFQVTVLDDWVHHLVLDAGSWDLFRFAPGDAAEAPVAMEQGAMPWFAHPALELHFWRPLSALTHALDHAVFGVSRVGPGVHSVAWYVALTGVITAIYRRVLPRDVALLAALLFALAGPHAQAVVWLSARNVLLCGALGGAGLLAHLAWRRDGWTPGAVLAPLGLAAGLAAGEAGLGLLAYVVAYELVGSTHAPGRRLLASLPAVGLGLAYLAVYVGLGYGVAHSGAYLDPLGEPLAFLAALPGRFVFALGVLLGGIGPDTWFSEAAGRPALILAGAAVAVPLGLWLTSTLVHLTPERRRPVLWLLLGAGLALLPQLAGLLGSRSFVLPGIGALAAVATLLRDAWRDGGRLLWLRRLGAVGVLAGHLGFGLALWGLMTWTLADRAAIADRALATLPDTEGAPLVLVNSPSADVAPYGLAQLLVEEGEAPRMLPVTVGPVAVTTRWTGPDTLEVDVEEGTLLDPGFARLYRRPGTLPAGSRVALDTLEVEVLQDVDGSPTRVAVTAAEDAVWLVWDGDGWTRLDPS